MIHHGDPEPLDDGLSVANPAIWGSAGNPDTAATVRSILELQYIESHQRIKLAVEQSLHVPDKHDTL